MTVEKQSNGLLISEKAYIGNTLAHWKFSDIKSEDYSFFRGAYTTVIDGTTVYHLPSAGAVLSRKSFK